MLFWRILGSIYGLGVKSRGEFMDYPAFCVCLTGSGRYHIFIGFFSSSWKIHEGTGGRGRGEKRGEGFDNGEMIIPY